MDNNLFWLFEEMVRKMEMEEMCVNYASSIHEEIMKKAALEEFFVKYKGEYKTHYEFIDNTYNDYEGLVTKCCERTSFRCVIPHLLYEKIEAIQDYQFVNKRFGVLPTQDTKLDYLDGYYSIGIERAWRDASLRELIEDFIYDFLIDENTHPRVGYKRRVFFEDSKGQSLKNGLILAIDPPNCIDEQPHFVICFAHED